MGVSSVGSGVSVGTSLVGLGTLGGVKVIMGERVRVGSCVGVSIGKVGKPDTLFAEILAL